MHHAHAALSEGVNSSSSASGVLASRLDPLRTIESLARLAVPAFADGCMINLIEEDGQLRWLHAVCADPAKQAVVDELARRYQPRTDRPAELVAVVQTRASRLVADIPERFWETITKDPEHLHWLRALASSRTFSRTRSSSPDRGGRVLPRVAAEGSHAVISVREGATNTSLPSPSFNSPR
jgi:hypothetical protein